MNFLLHRHLAARALSSAAAGHGAMLPDLWRMADRRVRAGHEAVVTPPGSGPATGCTASAAAAVDPVEVEVGAGIAHHLEADRWFHRSALFLDGERATAAAFRAAALGAQRMGLLAHAAWEVCLDGALVRRQGLGPTLAALRAGHAVAGARPSRQAAGRHHFDRVARSAEERAVFEWRMERIAERLLDGRWVGAYAHGEGLASVLDAMRRRLGLAPVSPTDHGRLAVVFDGLLQRATGVVGELLEAAP